MMQKGIVTINGVPTYVVTWGAWIEDNLQEFKDIIVCITGNPGVTGYYYTFLETINSALNIPVWIVSHAGHELPHNHTIPSLQSNNNLYDLQGQVDHKMEFFKSYVPRHVNVYLIGHSIGCKIIMELLKHQLIYLQVVKCYLLFPTIERMAVSPNGQFLTNLLKFALPVILFLSWIFTLFPTVIKKLLVNIYFMIHRTKYNVIRPTLKLINPTVLQNVFFLANDEMLKVKELDHDALNTFGSKLLLYYGTSDNWVPLKYSEDLKKTYPHIKVIICSNNYEHAFVLNSSKEIAGLICKWIRYSNSLEALS